jgi:type 1 glutamine amidotransferase
VKALAVAVLTLAAAAPADAADRVLVFTRTEGFRHDSIPAGIGTLRDEARRRGLSVTATEDPRALARLQRYRAVVFLSSTGDVLDPPQEQALERFVRGGGGWLGIHAAADAETGWTFYQGTLLGNASFAGHPAIQRATVVVTDRRHPATRHLPRRWVRTDEWYAFRRPPRPGTRVLARLDETSYDPGPAAMGPDHPIVWSRRVGRGRTFYTAIGHTTSSYAEPRVRRHLGAAMAWVARKR